MQNGSIQNCLYALPGKVSFAVTSSARGGVRLDAQFVVDGVHDPLPGPQIPVRGLHGLVSKQELNLLKFSTG